MMKLSLKFFLAIIFLTSLVLTNKSSAATVEYFTWQKPSQEFVNLTKVECDASEASLCQYMCGQTEWCVREETICTNCAGTNDLFLRLLFTRLQNNFSVTDQVWGNSNMIVYLADENYVLVTYQSVYNFYKVWGSEEVKIDFRAFCPAESVEPIFIVTLDSKNQPQDVAGVVCSDPQGRSYVRAVQNKNLKKEENGINQLTP